MTIDIKACERQPPQPLGRVHTNVVETILSQLPTPASEPKDIAMPPKKNATLRNQISSVKSRRGHAEGQQAREAPTVGEDTADDVAAGGDGAARRMSPSIGAEDSRAEEPLGVGVRQRLGQGNSISPANYLEITDQEVEEWIREYWGDRPRFSHHLVGTWPNWTKVVVDDLLGQVVDQSWIKEMAEEKVTFGPGVNQLDE